MAKFISLLLKLFLKITHKIIYKLCESQISSNQFGFINAVGTREVLFSVHVLFQRCRDVNFGVLACLIDYEKESKKLQDHRWQEKLFLRPRRQQRICPLEGLVKSISIFPISGYMAMYAHLFKSLPPSQISCCGGSQEITSSGYNSPSRYI